MKKLKTNIIKLKKQKKRKIEKIFIIERMNTHLVFITFEQKALFLEIFLTVKLLQKKLMKIRDEEIY